MGTIEGVIDRGVRITIGLVALVVGLASGLGTAVSTVLLVAAAIVFLTGVVGFCPLDRVFGVSTCAVRRS